MSRPKQTPSPQVDQKKLLDDKVKKSRANGFEDDHVRRVTPNGADGQYIVSNIFIAGLIRPAP